MTISLTKGKVARLRGFLLKWPRSRRYALESEVRDLLGTLLYASEVVRPGKFFVNRILNQLGLPPVKRWQEKLGGSSPRSRRGGRLALGPEFHADVGFWRLMMSEEFARLGCHLSSPLHTFFLRRRLRTLVSNASGTAVGGYCLETGAWWRFDLDRNAKSRLSEHVHGHDDLSINVLELLGMVVTAWALVVGAGSRPLFGGENVQMLGDNMAGVYWISKCRGGKELRSGILMRMLGCLEMQSGWYFRAKHVEGVANTLADGIPRWERDNVDRHLREHRPDINWQEQDLGQHGSDLCIGILASSTPLGQLRVRLSELTCHRSGLGSNFEG